MTTASGPRSETLQSLPHQGAHQLFPGLSVATMPRPHQLAEVRLAPQAQTIAIYARRGRRLDAPVSPELTDRRVRPRSVLVLPAGMATHWVFAAPLTDTAPRLQTLHMRLSADFAEVVERNIRPESLPPAMDLRIPGLGGRMEAALRAFEAPEAFRSVALQSAAFAAAMMLFDPHAAHARAEASSLTARRRRALTAYVDDNLSREVTLAGMADAVGLSPWHFIRVFKAAVGVTPYAWVVARRVDCVKQMLERGDASLARIAVACGFATQSHMTEVFRRTTGTTPGRWRRRLPSGQDHRETDEQD